jgi:hypothetical protein
VPSGILRVDSCCIRSAYRRLTNVSVVSGEKGKTWSQSAPCEIRFGLGLISALPQITSSQLNFGAVPFYCRARRALSGDGRRLGCASRHLSWYDSAMSYETSRTDSQPLRQNNQPDCTQPNLSESDIEELVRFFGCWTSGIGSRYPSGSRLDDCALPFEDPTNLFKYCFYVSLRKTDLGEAMNI